MSLSLLAVLALPLCFAPWATHRLYEQVARQKTVAIAVDNAGIVLGRAGREVLERWRRTSSRLEAAEIVHHALHLCARAPGPQAATCALQDRAWEELWEARLSLLEEETRLVWLNSVPESSREASSLGVSINIHGFSPVVPAERTVCPICGGLFRVRWSSPPRPVIRSSGEIPGEGAQVDWLQSDGWNFRMREVPHESERVAPL